MNQQPRCRLWIYPDETPFPVDNWIEVSAQILRISANPEDKDLPWGITLADGKTMYDVAAVAISGECKLKTDWSADNYWFPKMWIEVYGKLRISGSNAHIFPAAAPVEAQAVWNLVMKYYHSDQPGFDQEYKSLCQQAAQPVTQTQKEGDTTNGQRQQTVRPVTSACSTSDTGQAESTSPAQVMEVEEDALKLVDKIQAATPSTPEGEERQCAECNHKESDHFSSVMGSFCKQCPTDNNTWEHMFVFCGQQRSSPPQAAPLGVKEWREKYGKQRVQAGGFWNDDEVEAYTVTLREQLREAQQDAATYKKAAEGQQSVKEQYKAKWNKAESRAEQAEKELHKAINEPMYAGSRQDWIHRCQSAEAKAEQLQAQLEQIRQAIDSILEDYGDAESGTIGHIIVRRLISATKQTIKTGPPAPKEHKTS